MKQKQGAPPKYKGMVHTVRTVYAEEGVMSFWKGNSANVLRVVPVYSLKFSFNERFRDELKTRPGQKLSVSQKLAAGTASGLMTSLLTYPLETVRTRLALGKAFGSHYSGIFDCFKQTVYKESFGALYKGIMPTLWTGAPYVGLQMTFYDIFHDTLTAGVLRSKTLADGGGGGGGRGDRGVSGPATTTVGAPTTTAGAGAAAAAAAAAGEGAKAAAARSAKEQDEPTVDGLSALMIKLTAGALAGVTAQSLSESREREREPSQSSSLLKLTESPFEQCFLATPCGDACRPTA